MSPFKIDWSDKDAVIRYAKTLGSGMTVFKLPERNNYNIKHTSTYRGAASAVVFKT